MALMQVVLIDCFNQRRFPIDNFKGNYHHCFIKTKLFSENCHLRLISKNTFKNLKRRLTSYT